MKTHRLTSAAVIVSAFALAGTANAAIIFKIPNTGVDADGLVLAPGLSDPHWDVTVSPGSVGLGDAVVQANHPAWLANDSAGTEGSSWASIVPSASNIAPGRYTLETTFNIGTLDPNDLAIIGRWTSDNSANIDNTYGVFLNGVWTGLANQHSGGFNSWHDFNISSGFVPGVNTLAFTWNNAGAGNNPGGVRIEVFRNYVPEPGTGLFFAFGFGFLVLMRHRCVET